MQSILILQIYVYFFLIWLMRIPKLVSDNVNYVTYLEISL